ncbi:MAG TPA: AsmA-like C-terminal region-containing protein, partial [Chthoniobacterales bacterium]
MKKVSRIALYVAGAIFGVLAVALLAVNLYVQSQGTQARIQNELSQRIGTTLRIQRISVTPWWGLKLTGITIPQEAGSDAGNFLKADTFRLRVRLSSLFSSQLVIKEISLINPTVVWAQNSDGKWRLPVALAADVPAPAAGQLSAPATEGPLVRRDEVAPPSDAAEPGAAPFTPEIRRVKLTNGNFRFLDAKGRPVANFEGFAFQSTLRRTNDVRGTANVAKVSLRERFFLEGLKSPVKYDPSTLDFSDITARAGGGEITGRFFMRPGDPESPFEATVRFRDVQADQIVTAAGGPSGMVRGRIEGSLEANGKTADPNALAGSGEIYLRDGELRQYSLLVALGQVLQIDELTQLHFEQAQVKYHITPGVVMIDELLLTSPNIRLAAKGTVSFGGKLRLDSQLAINDRIRSQLFRGMRESFRPVEPAGYAAVDFKVTGTVERPKTDLHKLVRRDLQDLTGVISDLLGRTKRDRPGRNKPAVESAAAAAPAPTNSPANPAPQNPAAPPAASGDDETDEAPP